MKIIMGLAAATLLAASPTPDDGWPPARYQKPDITASIHFTSQTAVNEVCGKAPEGWTTRGCVITGQPITMQNPCLPMYHNDSYARLVCHELGHINGWTADHPRP